MQTVFYLEAEQECRTKYGGHLPSVHNAFDNMYLTQHAREIFSNDNRSNFWFGLNDITSSGKWSWMDNTTLDFMDWDKGQPQNISGANCGVINMIEGKWMADDCYKTYRFVCLMEATKPTTVMPSTTTTTQKPKICPETWTYFDETGFCYIVLKNETWPNSGERCKNEKAELASIHLLTEASFVANLSYSIADGTYDVWIGLFTNDSGAYWQWTDGTPFDLPNWSPGQPDGHGIENCGTIRKTGKLNNWVCSKMTKFVCKKLPS
uniref:C-type lectin domain-containing protein n=1 Tax=Panagrolaimus sp. PS1159 TaxID=55785 RepID=A0AC35GA25_9BILA